MKLPSAYSACRQFWSVKCNSVFGYKEGNYAECHAEITCVYGGDVMVIVPLPHLYVNYTHETSTMLSEKPSLHIPIALLI